MNYDIDENDMLFMLNTLGQTYNLSSGFNVNNFIVADMKDEKFRSFVQQSLEQNYVVKTQRGHKLYDISKIKNNERLYFETKFLEEKAKLGVVYDRVILKYPNKNLCELDKKYTTLSSLSKWDSINIEDILIETSKLCPDKNKLMVDFNYNKRNKYKILDKSSCVSITLEPGFTNSF